MTEKTDALVLDLVEWVAREPSVTAPITFARDGPWPLTRSGNPPKFMQSHPLCDRPVHPCRNVP